MSDATNKPTDTEKSRRRHEFINLIPDSDLAIIQKSPFLMKLVTICSMIHEEDPGLILPMLKEE